MSNLQFLYGKRVPASDEARTPLTHHDVLALVAPFSEAGRQVDLEASDRARRLLKFQPIEHAASAAMPALVEDLLLEVPEASTGDRPTLTRLLRADSPRGALQAVLKATGEGPATLLSWVDSVPVQRHWRRVGDSWFARSYRIRSPKSGGAPEAQFQAAEARFGEGVVLKVEQTLSASPFEVRLQALEDGGQLFLPPDFLSVAGRPWRALRPTSHRGWKGSLQAPSREPERTQAAEESLDEGVRHIAEALGAGPGEFHQRYKPARWRATLQRATPLLLMLAFLIATPGLMFLPSAKNPAFLVVIFQLPTVALIAFFSLRELPVLEIPPLPTPLKQSVWVQPATTSTKSV